MTLVKGIWLRNENAGPEPIDLFLRPAGGGLPDIVMLSSQVVAAATLFQWGTEFAMNAGDDVRILPRTANATGWTFYVWGAELTA